MNIHFHGDSWFWTWYYMDRKSPRLEYFNERISLYDLMLTKLGIPFKCHHKPGQALEHTLQGLLNLDITTLEPDSYHVIFVSSLVRGVDEILRYDYTNYDNFMNEISTDLNNHFLSLDKWSKQHNQRIILVGGHAPILEEHLSGCDNLTICIADVKKFLGSGRETHYFYFNNGIDYNRLPLEDFDHRIIEMFHENNLRIENKSEIRETGANAFFQPWDVGHPNMEAQLLIMDEIFCSIDQLENK